MLALSTLTSYSVDDVVFSGGTPYRCIQAHTNHLPPNTAYWLSATVIYSEGVATLPDSSNTAIRTQLRATLAPAARFPNAAGSVTTRLASAGTVDSYNSCSAPIIKRLRPSVLAAPIPVRRGSGRRQYLGHGGGNHQQE